MKNKVKTEIEYEDAPSGYVTFYNYKEPLMKFEQGFGYVGALLFDGESDKIQCHFCGEWYGSLSHHIAKEHNMRASGYKEEVGLLKNTALISESMRAKLIESGLDKRLQNLRAGGRQSAETKKKISRTLKQNAQKSEGMNLRGTCPAQLIDRMQKIVKENGGKRQGRDFHGFEALLRATFGSIKEACHIAGLPYNEPCKNHYTTKRIHTEETAIEFIKEYIVSFRIAPTYMDFKRQGKIVLYGSVIKNAKRLRELVIKAYSDIDEYTHTEDRVSYTKEQLITFLVNFEKNNGRKPSYSDCKRNLLPSLQRYIYHFGSWKNALVIAFKA